MDHAVSVGQRILAIGHPSGLTNTVSEGIVSGIRVLDSGLKLIQVDAAVSKGNSGGPVINSTGRAVGVVTFNCNVPFAVVR